MEVLVDEYETVKKQESERRTMYKNEKGQLEQEIEQLETRLQTPEDTDTAETEKFAQIEEQHKLVCDRLQKQRIILVDKIKFDFQISNKVNI